MAWVRGVSHHSAAKNNTEQTGPQALPRGFDHASLVPHAVIFVCNVAFALMGVIAKPALQHIAPLPFAALRVTGALPLLWATALAAEGPPLPLPREHLLPILALGVLGIFLPQSLIFLAVVILGPNLVAIMQPTMPVWVAVLSAAAGLERLTPLRVGGIAVAVAGALVVLDPSNLDVTGAHVRGLCLMLVQTGSYAAFMVLLQRTLRQLPRPFTLLACASSVGGGLLAATAVLWGPRTRWAAVPLSAWAALIYCSWVTSFAAHSALSYVAKSTSATVMSLYVCLQPPLTAAMSAALLHETLQLQDALGMLLILAGMLLVVYSKARDAAAPATPGGAPPPRATRVTRVTIGDQFQMPMPVDLGPSVAAMLFDADDDADDGIALLGGGARGRFRSTLDAVPEGGGRDESGFGGSKVAPLAVFLETAPLGSGALREKRTVSPFEREVPRQSCIPAAVYVADDGGEVEGGADRVLAGDSDKDDGQALLHLHSRSTG